VWVGVRWHTDTSIKRLSWVWIKVNVLSLWFFYFRIYLRLPQCTYFQDLPGYKQVTVVVCGVLVIVSLLIVFIHTFFLVDTEKNDHSHHHFLPTVSDINSQHSYFSYGPNVRYGIVIDCGSSGSRVYVYIWPPHSGNPKDLLSIQQLKDQYNQPVVKKVTPGNYDILCYHY